MTHTEQIEVTQTPSKLIVRVDATVLQAIDECNQKAFYAHGMHIVPSGAKSDSLLLGSCVHEFLRGHYLAMKEGADLTSMRAHAERIGEEYLKKSNGEVTLELFGTAFDLYRRYVIYYPAEQFTVQFVERPFSKILYEDDKVIIIVDGIIDLGISTRSFDFMPLDHKTAGPLSWNSKQFRPTELDIQFSTYVWATESKVLTVNRILTDLRKPASEAHQRILLSWHKGMIDEWRIDMIHKVMEHIRFFQAETFPRRRSACKLYYGCPYQKLCTAYENDRERMIKDDYETREPWDPLKRDS